VSHLTLLSFLFGLFFLFGKLLLLHSDLSTKNQMAFEALDWGKQDAEKIKHTYSSGVG
jgi:hypothetical protein